MRPTIGLVPGAFAASASWDRVIDVLMSRDHPVVAPSHLGHRVIATADPLRGLAADAAGVADLVPTIDGPLPLVGHSYGGAVISNVPADADDVTGLAPGDTCIGTGRPVRRQQARRRAAAPPTSRRDHRPVVTHNRFHAQFYADVPASEAALMAETQRPVTQEALAEPSGDQPLWREGPSWFGFVEADRNVPATLQHFMAERAGARPSVDVPRASQRSPSRNLT